MNTIAILKDVEFDFRFCAAIFMFGRKTKKLDCF